MDETTDKSSGRASPAFKFIVAAGAVIIAVLMLSGFFNYLNDHGVSTVVVSFLIVVVGLISLGSAGSRNYLPSLAILATGIFLFADSVNFFGDSLSWLWPVLIVLFGLLLLINKASPAKAS